MAELYLSQNELEKAVSIYRKLAHDTPADQTTRHRLNELEEWFEEENGGPAGLRKYTKELVQSIPGALSSMVMGFDGLALDSYHLGGSTLDITALLTEYSGVALQLRRLGEARPEVGAVNQLVVSTDKLTTLLHPLTEKYFLAVVLTSKGFRGKARYMLRVLTPGVLQELA
jgi:predicted regulator of Ras-like GTPase activity (Roadblock/LC7/MglB family)